MNKRYMTVAGIIAVCTLSYFFMTKQREADPFPPRCHLYTERTSYIGGKMMDLTLQTTLVHAPGQDSVHMFASGEVVEQENDQRYRIARNVTYTYKLLGKGMIQIQLADTDLQAYDDLSASLVDSLFGHSGGHQLIMIRKLNRNAYLIKLADNPLGICETDM